jgi:acetolactate synthase-1/2/3 large subunit
LAVGQQGLMLSRIGKAAGARVSTETFPTRVARGAGTAVIDRLAYLAELAIDSIKELDQLILIGAKAPVSFFAYPNVPSAIAPDSCNQFQLAGPNDDIDQVLESLLEKLDAVDVEPDVHGGGGRGHYQRPGDIPLDRYGPAPRLAEPDRRQHWLGPLTATAQPHDWLNQTGGSIGWGLPAAVGAAIACPDRKVLCLEGDGSAMYTVQALWTMAREHLDVTVVIFNNRKYSILEMEFGRTGARGGTPGPKAASTLDISGPDMDFVAMAQGMGVSATRATTAEEFNAQLEEALQAKGPRLIDAMVPTLF